MRIVDSRRLRGPNLQTPEPAAIAEVLLADGESAERAVAAWRAHVTRMASALGWTAYAKRAVARTFPGGIALALPAPVDVLFEATEVNEWAIGQASADTEGPTSGNFDEALERFHADVTEHADPKLVLLHDEARKRGVAFLWDDEHVTLGMARASATFDIRDLPPPEAVRWDALGRIPVALVTGTNGKTTTSRLIARMAKLAGLVAGSTSTDGIAVDEVVVEPGDWTGAEAARNVLRRPEVQIAILETARGGILRRGLALDMCDVALVTNVTSDHLGEFGVLDLATMARTKAVVGTIVRKDGRVVLNADDPMLTPFVGKFAARVALFGLDPDAPAVRSLVAAGGEAFVAKDGAFVRVEAKKETRLASIEEAPLTFRGAAVHNVSNALAAAAVAWGLGLPDAAIAGALRTFGARPTDNPGRGRHVKLPSGVGVLLDFGHNPAGLHHLFALGRALLGPEGCILLVATQPGDRTDEDFLALAKEICAVSPRHVFLWESEPYMRGREPGEIARGLARALAAAGVSAETVCAAAGEVDGLERAIDAARPGDLVIVAPEIDRDAVMAALARRGGL